MTKQIYSNLIIVFICHASILHLQSREFQVASPNKHLQMIIHIDAIEIPNNKHPACQVFTDIDDIYKWRAGKYQININCDLEFDILK